MSLTVGGTGAVVVLYREGEVTPAQSAQASHTSLFSISTVTMDTITAALLVLALCSCAAAAPQPRHRRRPGEPRTQPRFVTEDGGGFIYGHDDEPDYNDDHTAAFSGDLKPRFAAADFSSQFSEGGFQAPGSYSSPQQQQQEASYSPDTGSGPAVVDSDGFLDQFIQNNMKSFAQYQEAHQAPAPAPAQAQAAPAPEEAPLATEQEESSGGGEEPSLREFTLLVSKLLFHLSQM